jgi:DNA-binding transcriptional LysR family regulator
VSTTEEGQAYYAGCVQILDQLQETETSLQEARGIPSGTLRITVTPALAVTTLAPLLAPYHAKYPRVRVEISIDDRIVDIVREGFDLALRLFMGEMPNSSLIARPLTTFYEHLVASPRYFDEHGRPQTAADLVNHAVLGGAMLRSASSPLDLYGPQGMEVVRVSGPVGSDSSLVLRAAALDHLGIALIPEYAVREDIRTGVLERALPHYHAQPLRLCAVYPPYATLAARLRTFVDHLTENLATRR